MSAGTTVKAIAGQPVRAVGERLRREPRRMSRIEPFTVASYLVVTAFALFCLIPLWMIVAGSLTDEVVLSLKGYSLFPEPFSLDAYRQLFSGQAIGLAYRATLFITGVGTLLSLAGTASLAWVIARQMRRVSRPLTIFTYLPMLFSGGLVPMYLLITQVLQLRNSWFAVILPHMMTPFLVFITVSFFRQIPQEILESARVDGAGELRIFFQIILPLSKPVLAVIGLFYAVTYWNEWFMALLFISEPDKYPLQVLLQNMIANVTNATMLPGSNAGAISVYQLRLALTVVTIGPVILAYPFAQRYFVKGLTLGATKG